LHEITGKDYEDEIETASSSRIKAGGGDARYLVLRFANTVAYAGNIDNLKIEL